MAKRIADKELTDRNWDQEDEGEEAGTFSVASEDILKSRAIKKAKRRNIGEGDNSGSFKGFKGFALTASPGSGGTTTAGFSGFKGLSALTNGNSVTSTFGGFAAPAAAVSTPGLMFNGPASSTKASADITATQTNGSSTLGSTQSSSSSASSKEYSRQLTALNCSVRDWITKHVNDNPLCDLNPIFKDYERHLASIEKKYGAGAAAAAAAAAADGDSAEEKKKQADPPPPPSSFTISSAERLLSFGKDTDKSGGGAPVPAGITFNFGQKVDSSALGSLGSTSTSTSTFSFSSSTSSSQNSLFGGSAAPLSFSTTKAEDAQPAAENGDDESDEPPKPEVKEVKEEGAFYSKMCKLFYQKDSGYKEKGVGTLHLKPTAEGKTQMVIRAHTNLGNILLNILLQSSMPCSRVGKNNVLVVCVPNPAVDDKNPMSSVPMLIRMKTSEEADELLKTLEEKKI
ncbi:nuclear pore complex protein Nup50 [Genypterus blacodes]|uniref:nuclear pore complex protein Nup50 n=1 Tax=Genypterus blacodes TaxID=154954 RepID=UPI003F76851A